jgi:hypothetical protein
MDAPETADAAIAVRPATKRLVSAYPTAFRSVAGVSAATTDAKEPAAHAIPVMCATKSTAIALLVAFRIVMESSVVSIRNAIRNAMLVQSVKSATYRANLVFRSVFRTVTEKNVETMGAKDPVEIVIRPKSAIRKDNAWS